eukprot:TRINITY_DN872_c0_g1_i1.p1 TRINITY_DN872_c0_g1~~TRINITY_DN872_c0_g1_i1.p1  ORF type:complete len:1088 (-),score=219.80 TRINITY_DN872_c0_g1_i1:370-3633(-)
MVCPANCPGPRVPHHCKKVSKTGSLRQEIAALKASVQKKRTKHVVPAMWMRSQAVVPPQCRENSGAAAASSVADRQVGVELKTTEMPSDVADSLEVEVAVASTVDSAEPEATASETIAATEPEADATTSLTTDDEADIYPQAQEQDARDQHIEGQRWADAVDSEAEEETLSMEQPRLRRHRLQLPSKPLVMTVDMRVSVRQLFSAVTGMLNSSYKVLPEECKDSVQLWLDASDAHPCAVDLTTVSDCLALALQSGAVPLKGLTTLFSLQAEMGTRCKESVLIESLAARLTWFSEELVSGRVPLDQWDGLQKLKEALETVGDGDAFFDASQQFRKALAAVACSMCQERPPADRDCKVCNGAGELACEKCKGTGKFSQPCRRCSGAGYFRRGFARQEACSKCSGSGSVVLGECRACNGQRTGKTCYACQEGKSFCSGCVALRLQERQAQEKEEAAKQAERQAQRPMRSVPRQMGPPAEGVSITRAGAGDLAHLQNLWQERINAGQFFGYGYSCEYASNLITEAWSIDNPLLSWRFSERRKELKQSLGRDPDELDGFHGSAPSNYLSIVQGGFRSDLRCGQVFGSGEYFAKNPQVSVSYCRGGQYMLVCRLLLGEESLSRANTDGDYIWAEETQYYVMSKPAQVLPKFLVKFARHGTQDAELERVLGLGHWSTKKAEEIVAVPPNRPCVMSRDSAVVLWMGFLHAHFSDEELEADVRTFFQEHAAAYTEGMKIQIVQGHFKKAHAILEKAMPRELVHRLNKLPFREGKQERTICVEDAHGSPEQKCPKFIAKYCRGQNLRFTTPCWCWHPRRETNRARFELEEIDIWSAKGNELSSKFMNSAPFHNGQPYIVSIKKVKNEVLSRLHEEYRQYLKTKHREEPSVRELYHGTNNNIHDVLFQHGLQPPSDCNASDLCPVSGGMGLSTTLCDNTCKFCTEKHEWNRCHMYGLGIYLADMAQKSHRYVSQAKSTGRGRSQYKMVVCSVLGRAYKVEGHLREKDGMHDVANVKVLSSAEMNELVEPCCAAQRRPGRSGAACTADLSSETSPDKCDLMFVQGLGSNSRPGWSVYNSEYIAYHPHQCLPKYEITYEL